MKSPKTLLQKDKDRFNAIADYIADPRFEEALSIAFAQFAFNLRPDSNPSVNEIKRQGAMEFADVALGIGKPQEPSSAPKPFGLGPLPGDPGYDEWVKKFNASKQQQS